VVMMPEAQRARQVLRAVVGSSCTWWCTARFFVDRVHIHPTMAVAMRTLLTNVQVESCAAVKSARCAAAAALGLALHRREPEGENEVYLKAGSAEAVLRRAVAEAARSQRLQPEAGTVYFRCTGGAAQHALRMAARAMLLRSIKQTRADAEGWAEVDLYANVHPRLRKWEDQLTKQDATAFRIWRGGAAWTPTRRWFRREDVPEDDARLGCPLCGAEGCSARHYFAECPALAHHRELIATKYRVPEGWWAAQPRITSKSGWVTLGAAATEARRVDLAIAAAEMGVVIVRETPKLTRADVEAEVYGEQEEEHGGRHPEHIVGGKVVEEVTSFRDWDDAYS
jgi:hypothetical protein